MNNKKVLLFNASALKETVCAKRFFNTVLEGYKENITYNDTHYGSCFHKFVSELTLSEGNFAIAVKSAWKMWDEKKDKLTVRNKKDHLDKVHLTNTCNKYFSEEWEKDKNSYEVYCDSCNEALTNPTINPLVEMKFHIPYYSDDNIDVILTGTLDRLVKIKNGAPCIRDYKTTSTWDKYKYLDNYALSPQLRFYFLLLKLQAGLYPESIFAQMYNGGRCGTAIDGVFLSSTKETEFKSSEVYFFPEEDIKTFELMIHSEVMKAVNIYTLSKGGILPAKNGILINACSGFYSTRCPYFDTSRAINPTIEKHIMNNNFIQTPYGMEVYGEE